MGKSSVLGDIQSVAQEFLDHSNEEQGHADRLAERVVQLGGAPDFLVRGLDELAELLVAFPKESDGKRQSANAR